MATTKSRPCGNCGKGVFQMADIHGRTFAYRDERALALPASIMMPVCTVCGEIRVGASDTARLDEALEPAYMALRAATTRDLVDRLVAAGWRQLDIEQAMGLSQGYISKAVRGEKALAVSNLRHLYLLALHPRSTLSDLAPYFPQVKELEEALDRRGVLAAV